ncbi:MAG: DUF642 domain-containing protein [Akkermansiaceae bacterium]
MKIKNILMASIFTGMTYVSATAASLIVNGGFESGTVNSTPTSWTSGFTGGAADPFVRAGTNQGVAQTEGSNHLQLRGNTTGGAFLGQSFLTVASQQYDLDFSLASTASFSDLSVLVTVTSDGGTSGDLYSETFTFSGTTYTDYNKSFTASNTSATLRFEETSTDTNSKDPFLDAVSVTPVPEPSSSALLGLGVLSLLVRRHRA